MAFVAGTGMAEHPKQLLTSKIRGKCAGKWHGKACGQAVIIYGHFQRQMCFMRQSMKAGTFQNRNGRPSYLGFFGFFHKLTWTMSGQL